MSSRVLTIDIQQERVSLAVLTHGLKGIRIAASECLETTQENMGADDPFEGIREIIKKFLAELDGRYDRCIVSIPAVYCFFRTVELPFKGRKKINQILSYELENNIPFSVESIECDFNLLEKNSKKASDAHAVSVAGLPHDKLQQFQTLFQECGIEPEVITIGNGYSKALAFARNSDLTEFSFFIHMEAFSAAIYSVRFGEIAYIRTFPLTSDNPVNTITTNLSHTILSFNELFNTFSEPDNLVLSGSVSLPDELGTALEKEFTKPVQKFDFFHAVKSAPFAGELTNPDYSGLQNAIAAGFNDIKRYDGYNFMRHVSGSALFYQENKSHIIALAVLLLFFLASWSANPVLEINRMEKKIEKLDNDILETFHSCFPDIQAVVDPVQQMKVKIDEIRKKRSLDFLNMDHLNIDLLYKISSVLPDSLDIIFTRLVRTERKLLLSGSSDQFNTVDQMKTHFENVKIFKEVEINSASMDKTENRVKFNLKVVF